MSWLSSSGFGFQFRYDVVVDASSLTGTANTDGTTDAQVVLPSTLDQLWAALGGSSDELEVTQADGVTLLDFKLTDAAFTGAASVANRDVGIQVDNLPIRYGADGNGRLQRFCIYVKRSGYTNSPASFTASSPLTGTLELGSPQGAARRLVATPEQPGQTLARNVISKTSGESVDVWLDVTALLTRRFTSYGRSDAYEEVLELLNDSETSGMREISGGTTTRTMVDMAECTTQTLGGHHWLKVYVTAGTDATDYAVIVPFRTSLNRVLEARFRVQVRDVDDT